MSLFWTNNEKLNLDEAGSNRNCLIHRTYDSAKTVLASFIKPLLPNAKSYEGQTLTSAKTGLIYLPVVQDSRIEQIYIVAGANVPGSAVFNIRKNDTFLFDDTTRPVISVGNKSILKSFLAIDVVRGDAVWLDLITAPVGGVQTPITLVAMMRAA